MRSPVAMDTALNATFSGGLGVSNVSGPAGVSPYSTAETLLIVLVTGCLSLLTVIGNILVMLSIKVNRNLQTVNNYFLFSLACADLIIGLCSMNLYTLYIVIGHWPLGPVVCDLWLAVDYVVSNASVMNLLIISFDRYFCVTKPLSYPARRSTKMAGLMIAAAWLLSFVLWAPAILFWQFVAGGRTVPSGQCYIQFFSNPAVTFGTAIAAFYLPVGIMIGLYSRVSRASRSRVKNSASRKPSGSASLGEGAPSQSQEDGGEGEPDHCTVTGDEEEGGGRGGEEGETAEEQQRNGRCPGGGARFETGESSTTNESSVSVPLSASGRREKEAKPRRGLNGETRPGRAQDPDPQTRPTTGCGPDFACIRGSQRTGPGTTRTTPDRASAPHTPERQSLVARTLLKVTVLRSPQRKTKRKGRPPSREKKVTRTIMAILVAFVATWTPYNVMVLINTFCSSSGCVPAWLWTLGYWLCYINSTVNPACYALCNATFKNTFRQLLLCQYRNIRTAR